LHNGQAGDSAQSRNAFKEAQESYERALSLLSLLPESSARDGREIELRQSVVRMLQVTRGFSAPETINANQRAGALAEKIGNLRQLFTWVNSRWIAALISRDLAAAGVLAEQALDVALREGSASNIGFAHTLQMHTRFWRGDLAGAEEDLTAGLKFFDDPVKQLPNAATTFGYASWNAWMLGRVDVARERMAQTMRAATDKTPGEVAYSRILAAQLLVLMREYEQAETLAAQALELSEKDQSAFAIAFSQSVLGSARAELGRATEGVRLIRQAIAGYLEIGARVGNGRTMASLAAAQLREGSIAEALKTVEEDLQTDPDEFLFRPEILRLRGVLRLKQGRTELAEAGFREAIKLAQKMSAKAWELRAATSLARLLRQQGKVEEALKTLAEIYNWFAEGFDTADLKDAKALLDELGA
jgi:tetratricopeptide (TPR) repeat protein